MSTPKTTEAQKFLDKDMLQYLLDQLSGKIIAGCCGCGKVDLTDYPTKTDLTSVINAVLTPAKLSNDESSITLVRPKSITSLDPVTIETETDKVQFKTINGESILGEGDIEISSSSDGSGSGSGSGSGDGDGSGTTINLDDYVKFTDEATTEKNGVLTKTDKAYIDLLANYIVETNTSKDYKIPLDSLGKFFGEFLNNNVALTSDSSALGEKDEGKYDNAEYLQIWDVDGKNPLFGGVHIAINYANADHAGLMSATDKIALDNLQEVLPAYGNYMSNIIDDGWFTWGVSAQFNKLVPICQTSNKLFVKVLLREAEEQTMVVTRSTDGENYSFVGQVYENYGTQTIDQEGNVTDFHNWEGIVVFDGYRDDGMKFHITGPYYKIVYAEDIGM